MARARKPSTEARRADRGEAAFRASVGSLLEDLVGARRPWPLKKARHLFERAYAQYVIQRAGADRQTAAGQLDIGFSTLKEKIRSK
jgi:DNA-binding NtrC family response regulator